MANKIRTERCGDQIKVEKTTKLKKNILTEKLQSNLEKDILRNVYTNFHSSKEEDSIIKHLQESKTHSAEKNATDSFYLLPAATNPVSPESDLFFTPESSPSELQKSFAPELKKSKENVVSYYRIVSVDDDIPIDDKSERSHKINEIHSEKAEEKLLEQELAEQDELLLSFKTISVRKNKNQILNRSNSSQSTKKTKPKVDQKKFESGTNSNETREKLRNKLHLWKLPNHLSDESGGQVSKQHKSTKRTRIYQICQGKIGEKESAGDFIENFFCNSDMDVSGTGCDSGLDTSSVCQPEASPRENTVSETSGVDLTESITNDEILNDETISANQQTGSIESSSSSSSSSSSEAGTWDAKDGDHSKGTNGNGINGSMETNGDFVSSGGEDNRINAEDRDSDDKNNYLNEEELIRLDEMERTIRECEMFLSMERNQSHGYGFAHSRDSPSGDSRSDENVQKEIHQTEEDWKKNSSDSEKHQQDGGEGENKFSVDDRNEKWPEEEKDSSSGGSVWQQVEFDDPNRMNPELGIFNSDSDSDVKLRADEIEETKTPPCTPKKPKPEEGFENPKNQEGIKFPEVKSENKWENNNNISHNHSSGNYFIDASSLLDDDEIVSPPISLINFRSIPDGDERDGAEGMAKEPETRKKIISNFYYDPHPDTEKESESFRLMEKERQQGDVIFKNSIPHFSKHEIEAVTDVSREETLRRGADRCDDEEDGLVDDGEQVVPTADPPVNSTEFQREEFSNLRRVSSRDEGNSESKNSSSSIVPEEENLGQVRSKSSFEWNSIDDDGDSSRNENSRMESVWKMDFPNGKKEPSRNQAEAWVVTFEDDKIKSKNKMAGRIESVPKMATNEKDEMEEEKQKLVSNRKSPHESFNNFNDEKHTANQEEEEEEINSPKQMGFAIEKSSSLGYFLDFGKGNDRSEPAQGKSEKPPENRAEKKNIFSMFIGMDDVPAEKKSKSVYEKERISDGSSRGGTPENVSATVVAAGTGRDSVESQEEMKKSFYMFIESDSPSVKRKQIPKKATTKSSGEFRPTEENAVAKRRIQSLSAVQHSSNETEDSKPETTKNDFDSGNFSQMESTSSLKTIREPETTDQPSKFMAWAETKSSARTGSNSSTESWLKTKDILVNYTGRNVDRNVSDLGRRKDKSDFVQIGEGRIKPKEVSAEGEDQSKSSGDSAKKKTKERFLKLSDMDDVISGEVTSISRERMSQSVSEIGSRGKSFPVEMGDRSSSLSKSTGNEISRVHRSLSRIFPNVSSHHLASLSRRDEGKGERERNGNQGSQHSEVSSSMQSSMEPSPLEISTSETDVSTHGGATSRLGEDLLKMFLEEIAPDVTLEVSGRRIKAHKCILSSRCQYFAAMLSGGWVESAGNVISLQGFSYNAVHFALRYIYSGESRIPESLNMVELATLADMLCLDGLQEIISYDLKVKYCHSFHAPCSTCSVGVIDCLPIAAAYGLDDLYRKCLRWITKYFVKLWPTKSFGSLPKELLEKCYQHHVVHLTVDNVLDTIVNIDKVRGSLTNVRWADSVSRLIKKLHAAAVRYIAEHFSSILTSDGFLTLGKDDGWNVSRLEDSLIETINYLPPEQACWSHARLHRILSVVNGHDPPPEMDWNENFVKLLNLIGELVENSLIKQAPRAARSKAWRQLEPELRSRIQEAACLVLPDEEPTHRKPHHVKKNSSQLKMAAEPAASRRSLEIRQIKLAMSQQANRSSSRPLSLQPDQKPKKESRFVPLRPSASTSSVRKSEPQVETIRKSQSKSQILGSAISEPKKTINPRYSEVKSRYLEPKSPQKSAAEKHGTNSNQRRNSSVSGSSRSSSVLRPSDSRNSIPLSSRISLGSNRQSSRNSVLRSDSATTVDNGRHDKSFASTRSQTPSNAKMQTRLTTEETMSTDSLCTDSLKSEKEATVGRRRRDEIGWNEGRMNGRENRFGTRSSSVTPAKSKPATKSHKSAESRSTAGTGTKSNQKSIIPTAKSIGDGKWKRPNPGSIVGNPTRIPNSIRSNQVASSPSSIPRTVAAANRNPNASNKIDTNLLNGNAFGRRKTEFDSENNEMRTKKDIQTPRALSRSGTFLKEEPTILKKPQQETEAIGRF